MRETAQDDIGQALLRAFAEQGYEAALPDLHTISVRLPDGTTANADISAWRDHAANAGPGALQEAAAGYAAQAAAAFGRGSERIRDQDLRMRLYTDDALGEMRDSLVTRRLAPGLIETVVVDYPDSIMPLDRARLGDAPQDAAFGAAVAHSLAEEHYASTSSVGGVPVTHIGGTHRYVGAHAHVLRRHTGQAPYGALVSFPLPEYVLVHEIGGEAHLFAAMEAVQDLSRRLYDTGDKALSPQVYWWRPGRHEELPEAEALRSGLVPDLRPVGVQVDHQERSVAFQSADTGELAELWMRDHG
ncbi:hypothetical protein GCM10022224_069180 [Nonomuraea antimicrobica]|uniref:Uncharacterized protein n=1 Tax=Nonomuraea antimicrobica TaxID=561173 RepID=A0ABP7CNJ2_9ACTN